MGTYRGALSIIAIFLAVQACVPARQFEELKAKQQECEQERNRLTEENRKLSTDLKELQAEVDLLRKEKAMLVEDSLRTGRNFRKMQEQFHKLNTLNDELIAKQAALRAEGAEENRKLLEDLRNTQLELQSREDALRQLEAELNAKERNLNQLGIELEAREARVKELEDLLAQKDAAVRALKDRIAAALLGFKDKGLTVEQRDGKIYVSLEAKLLFASGSTKIDPEGKKALLDLANAIKEEKDITILVEGHTDTDPFLGGGTIKDNWDLSVMRATSVVKILTQEGKLDPAILTAAGRGEHVPVAPNTTAEGKAKNRRIEIILTPNLDELFKIINE